MKCCEAMAESVCVTGKAREGERSRSQFWWWHWGRGLLAWKGPVCDHDVIRSIQWDRLEEASVLRYTQGTSLPTGSEQGPERRSDTQEVVSHTQTQVNAYLHGYTHACDFMLWHTHTHTHYLLQVGNQHVTQMDSSVWPLTADRCFCYKTWWIPRYVSGHLCGQMCFINERTQMDNTHTTHTHTHGPRARAVLSCCVYTGVAVCTSLLFTHTDSCSVFVSMFNEGLGVWGPYCCQELL